MGVQGTNFGAFHLTWVHQPLSSYQALKSTEPSYEDSRTQKGIALQGLTAAPGNNTVTGGIKGKCIPISS